MKKILVFIFVLLSAIAFMAYFYFSKLGTENNAKDLALQSATNNAAVVFSFRNDKSFYEIIAAQQLIQQVIGEEKSELLSQLKNLVINNNTLNGYINDQNIYISLLPDSNKKINFLITVQLQPEKDLSKLNSALQSSSFISSFGEDIYKIKVTDSLLAYARLKDRVITVSTSLQLINNASVRLAENPFTDYIKENSRNNKNALAQVYINFNQAPLLLKNILSKNIDGNLSVLNKQNSYAALNYNFSKEKVLFNGTTSLKNEDNYLKLFENSHPQSTTIQNILPENTANYIIYTFNDYKTWSANFNTYLARTKQLEKTRTAINNVKKDFRTDLNTVFPVYTKNQFTTFQLNTAEKIAAIELSNGEKVKQLLIDVSTDYSEDIKIFKSSHILYSYFGEPFRNFSRPYYTIIDNYLIVANNASTIQSFLNSYKTNKLLAQTAEYREAMNEISTTFNVGYYINIKRSSTILKGEILTDYYTQFHTDNGLKTFDTFCYQMIADKTNFITNVLLNKYLQPEVPDSLTSRL